MPKVFDMTIPAPENLPANLCKRILLESVESGSSANLASLRRVDSLAAQIEAANGTLTLDKADLDMLRQKFNEHLPRCRNDKWIRQCLFALDASITGAVEREVK